MKKVGWLTLLFIIWYLEYSLHRKNRVFVIPLPFGLRGCFIPPIGTFIDPAHHTSQVLEHETCHYNQWKNMGSAGFLIWYILEYLRYGYNDMPMEQECRTNEPAICQQNYTNCYPKSF